ncbi:MAG: DUF2953 domain-containing protein [Faecousia sp.]
MGWLIALAIVLLIAFLPMGVSVRYDSGGLLVRIIAGCFHYTIFPLKKRKKKPVKESESTDESKPEQKEMTASQPKSDPQTGSPQKGGSIRDFLPLIKVALDFLNQFRKKMRINHLQLKLILAGDDPCDLAVNYGRAWAALGNLLPMLEKVFIIEKRDCEVECDFTADETLVIARMELTLLVWQLVSLGAVYGVRLLKELLIFKKKRKGGAVS